MDLRVSGQQTQSASKTERSMLPSQTESKVIQPVPNLECRGRNEVCASELQGVAPLDHARGGSLVQTKVHARPWASVAGGTAQAPNILCTAHSPIVYRLSLCFFLAQVPLMRIENNNCVYSTSSRWCVPSFFPMNRGSRVVSSTQP